MQSPWTHVRGFESLSLCDWPGKTVCVIFMAGCNLRCPTCHNADLAWGFEDLPVIPQKPLEKYLALRGRWLDGIVISGGEPTTVPDLSLILHDLSRFGLPIKVDTNGMRPTVVEDLLISGLAREFFVDVKGPFEKYPALTGGRVTAEQARTRLGRIFDLAVKWPGAFTFRQTQVPALTPSDVDVSRSYLPSGYTLNIQTYNAPRRMHAQADQEEGRVPGNMVGGSHSPGHSQSAQGQRDQGPAFGQAVGA